MAIDNRYIPLFTIEDVLLDKDTGLPLSGGIVSFFEDSQRTTPKDVFQLSGYPDYTYVSMGSVLILSSIGTFEDSLGNPTVPYAFPFLPDGITPDLYYVTVTNAGFIPQFTREAVPYVSIDFNVDESLASTDNQIENPQFVKVNFSPLNDTVINVTGTNTVTNIAPDWDIITSGTGTVTLTQLAIFATDIVSQPPFALDINNSGITSLKLRQRFNNSPRIFSGLSVCSSFIAKSVSGIPITLTLSYVPSTGASTQLIQASTGATATFIRLSNVVVLPQVNTDPGTIGYVDFILNIPVGFEIQLSSFMIVQVPSQTIDVSYPQETSDRQIDHLFHYYKNSLIMMPKEDLLTGWVFGSNPWQFTTTALSLVMTKTSYTADQTILVQQAAGNNISVGQAPIAERNGYLVQAATNTNQFSLIQYIDPSTIRPYWGNVVSSLVKARIFTSNSSVVNFKMRLIYRTSLPSTIGASEPIASWSSGGDPVFSAGWTAIAPLNDPIYTLNNSYDTSEGASAYSAYSFDGFSLPACSNSAQTLGVVIYTVSNMTSTGTPDKIIFDKISLVPNHFAIDSTPLTFDEHLRKCQFYYEKSYQLSDLAGTSTILNSITKLQTAYQGTIQNFLATSPFDITFKSFKRTAPLIVPYNELGVINKVIATLYENAVVFSTSSVDFLTTVNSYWNIAQTSNNNIDFVPSGFSAQLLSSPDAFLGTGFIRFHYTADARLGV